METQNPRIVIKEETKELLKRLGNKEETYDDVIQKLLDFYLKRTKKRIVKNGS